MWNNRKQSKAVEQTETKATKPPKREGNGGKHQMNTLKERWVTLKLVRKMTNERTEGILRTAKRKQDKH